VLDDFGGRLGWAWRETDAESADRAALIRDLWTSNDDGVPMSVNTLNKALRIMGCDTGPGGDHCAHGLRSTASPLLNGDIVEAQLAHETEKKAPAARRGGSAPTWQWRQEQDPRHL